ncbi:hypothetical protein F7R06_29075 [Pseudomonas moorei]|nr:hypothetical protein F7R06_29075 [Pseudomonas moorei]
MIKTFISKTSDDANLGAVGASLLAMVVNDNAECLKHCGVYSFFASKLAPTVSGRMLSDGSGACR